MQQTLEMRHITPTAPDTLRCFPYVDGDPFVITEGPHVYFCGNQDCYAEKLIVAPGSTAAHSRAVKMISVPAFRRSRSVALLDVNTLQSYEVKFDLS